jgi:hypothetical protein
MGRWLCPRASVCSSLLIFYILFTRSLIICHHREHGRQVSVTETVSQSKASRGIFAFWRRAKPVFKPTYAHEPDAAACRIYGSLLVKKVTGMYSLTCVMQWVQRGAWKLTGLCFVF